DRSRRFQYNGWNRTDILLRTLSFRHMDKEIVIQKIYNLLESSLKIERTTITPGKKLTDLTADSIQLFELILLFEKEFSLAVTYDDLIRIETVQDTIDY